MQQRCFESHVPVSSNPWRDADYCTFVAAVATLDDSRLGVAFSAPGSDATSDRRRAIAARKGEFHDGASAA
jgi:hypothetical protein